MDLDVSKERKIIEKSKRHKSKFDPIYRKYKPKIERFFYNRVYDKNEIEDLTSKTFVKTLKGIDNFKWQGVGFSTWIYKIARNTLIDYYREHGKKSNNKNVEDLSNILKNSQSLEERVYEIDTSERLAKAIKNLDFRAKQIVYMKFYEGYTNKEISKKLAISETNVGTIVYRSVNKLKMDKNLIN